MTGSLLLAGLAGWLTLGCGQGEGDRCEINSDCNEGTCDFTNGYGICRLNPTTSKPSTPDAAPTSDASGTTPDAGALDAGKVDAVDAAPAVDANADVSVGDGGHDHGG